MTQIDLHDHDHVVSRESITREPIYVHRDKVQQLRAKNIRLVDRNIELQKEIIRLRDKIKVLEQAQQEKKLVGNLTIIVIEGR